MSDVGHLYLLYHYPYISKVAFGTILFCTNFIYTPPKEGLKPLARILFVYRLSFLDIGLQLGEEFLDRVEIRRIRRQVQ